MHPDAISHVIQLAVAPVFLLTGVGAILGVLASRLARTVDRARLLERQLADCQGSTTELHGALRNLSHRARLINWAISLCVTCALLICAVIVALFVGAFWSLNTRGFVGVLFSGAMLALIGGLLCFLREVYSATANLRIGPK